MPLRQEWKTAKDHAFDEFKHDHPPTGNLHTTPPKAYPMKFNKDLGPTLDSYEKAKAQPDKIKFGKKAKDILKIYKADVEKSKNDLGGHAYKTLHDCLVKIDTHVVDK